MIYLMNMIIELKIENCLRTIFPHPLSPLQTGEGKGVINGE
jgi:hypothetical protein